MVNEMKTTDGFQGTEIGIIPEEWNIVQLVKIATMKARIGWQGLTVSEYLNSGEYYLITGTDFQNGKINWNGCNFVDKERYIQDKNIQIEHGDILITKDGTIGKVAYVENPLGPATLNSGIFVIRPKNDQYSSLFLFYIFKSVYFNNFLNRLVAGSTIIHLYQKDFISFEFPLPPTKAEQTAIATALSDMDALIEGLEKLIEKKKMIKQGAMQELLTPKEGWEELELGKSATLKARIGWQGLTTKEYKKTGDYFLITGTEFKNGYIDWRNCHYVEYERYRQDKNIQIQPHDVLVTKDGTIGKVALVNSVPKPATLNSGVFVIRPVNNSFHPEFFYFLLLSEVFLTFLSQLSAGSTINHLYQKDFVNFKFLAPASIEEQKEIANILFDMDQEIGQLETQLSKYKLLKTGMMQELLTGKKRLI